MTKKSNDSGKTLNYCVLVGANLNSYESSQNYQRGDHPTAMVHIVGASAWNPSGTAHGSSSNADSSTHFRLVTEQGTHLYCAAPTSTCRDLWLGALHAGLDRSLLESGIPKQQPLQPPAPAKTGSRLRPRIKKHCFSCGVVEEATVTPIRSKCVPVPHYAKETRCDLCQSCLVAQGLLNHVCFLRELLASAQHERKALLLAKQLCWNAMKEVNPDLEREVQEAAALAVAEASNEMSSLSSPSNATTTTTTTTGETTHEGSSSSSKESSTNSWTVVDDPFQSQAWIHLPPTLETNKAVIKLINTSADFLSLQRISLTLETCCEQIQQGVMGVPDMLEQIENVLGSANKANGMILDQHAEMKKQAFRVAGDMGTAMKLLHDLALPRNEYLQQQQQHSNLDMFICLLEFLLDLCEGGELASVAAFWPQLCHIHLRMLPCKNIAELQRVELLEDFLLTVSTKFSIHLALDLVWSHTADLEESLVNIKDCSPTCRRRRYAVLRFVCELESLLFGKVGGWGSGSVSLGKMFAPSDHQNALIKLYMENVQEFRKETPQFLTRSVRMESLSHAKFEKDPEVAVMEAMRIARNADYLSSHLNFSRRLCDIAEKMFQIEVKDRAGALQVELGLLNASGTMGGDPLNSCLEHHIRVVGLPSKEGHVFRSKERTPVLLLAEVFDDTVEDDAEQLVSKLKETATSRVASPVNNAQATSNDDNDEFSECSQPNSTAAGKDDSDVFEDAKEEDVRELSASQLVRQLSASRLGDSHSLDEDGMYSPKHARAVMKGDSCASPARSSSLPLEGSMDESAKNSNTAPHALKRFDKPADEMEEEPQTPTMEAVGEMVTQTMVKQLGLPDLETTQEVAEENLNNGSDGDGKHEKINKREARNIPRILSNQSILSDEEIDIEKRSSKKMSSLNAGDHVGDSTQGFAPTGDLRRDVLNHIFLRGIQGSNTIAAGTQAAVQLSLQELEHRRAVELLMHDSVAELEGADANGPDASFVEIRKNERMAALGIDNRSDERSNGGTANEAPTEEDEALEAIRLLLIQNRVAQGGMSPVVAAKVLQHAATQKVRADSSGSQDFKPGDTDAPLVDAGDIDPRLVGCGELTPAVLQALTLWKAEMVTNGELLELVTKDLEHGRQTSTQDTVEKLQEDSAFWGRFAFGERWAEKKARIALSSVHGKRAGWDLMGVIVKSNDDLRQEKFVMQLIELCQEAFQVAGLELWVLPYRIVPTGRSTGIIELVKNSMSFDGLKKRPGYGKGGLREHLLRMTEFMPDPTSAFRTAQRNFVRSLAAYSLMSYFFLFKDRHNGNILLDTAGHIVHIDFGFVFGIAPGGNFSLEISTPFKLTEEMVEVMDGIDSPVFSEFVILFCCGFLALQSHFGTFLTLVEITSKESTFPCFEGRDSEVILDELEARFRPDLDTEKTIAFALDIIQQATSSYGTKQYDYFQYLSQGIAT